MTNLGSAAQAAGKQAEASVAANLNQAGWVTHQSADLDYAGKIDLVAVCPVGTETAVQVSTSPKSNRQLQALEARGVLPLATSELTRTNTSAADFICNNCVTKECLPVK